MSAEIAILESLAAGMRYSNEQLARVLAWQERHDKTHARADEKASERREDLARQLGRIETQLETAGSPVQQAKEIGDLRTAIAEVRGKIYTTRAVLGAAVVGAIPGLIGLLQQVVAFASGPHAKAPGQ